MEISTELVHSSSISRKSYNKRSFEKIKDINENLTSIGEQVMKLEDLIRELILSSNIYLDENQMQNTVNTYLNKVFVLQNNSHNTRQVLEMSLRGYLGIINELLFLRHTFIRSLEETFGVYINIWSRRVQLI